MAWTKAKVEKAWRIFKAANKVIADALEVPPDELEDLICAGVLPAFNPNASLTDEQIAEMNRAANSPAWLDEEPPAPTPEIVDHLAKRATLADLAPPAPEVLLEQAAPIVDKPIEFTTTPPFETMSPGTQDAVSSIVKAAAVHFSDQHAQSMAKAERDGVGEKVEEILRPAKPAPSKRVPAPKTFNRGSLRTSLDLETPGSVRAGVDTVIDDRNDETRVKPPIRHAERLKPVAAPKAGPKLFYLMDGDKYLHESCTGLTDKRAHAWRQPENKIAAVRKKFPETVDYREVPAL